MLVIHRAIVSLLSPCHFVIWGWEALIVVVLPTIVLLRSIVVIERSIALAVIPTVTSVVMRHVWQDRIRHQPSNRRLIVLSAIWPSDREQRAQNGGREEE